MRSFISFSIDSSVINSRQIPALILLILFFSNSFAQKLSKKDEKTIGTLKKHIEYLASDELEGRGTGSAGEKKAAEYIIREFKKLGLKPPAGKDTYLQPFTYTAQKFLGANNEFVLLNENTSPGLMRDYYPLSSSGNATVTGYTLNVDFGIVAPEWYHDDYFGLKNTEGKIFIIEISTPDGTSPHGKFAKYTDLNDRVSLAVSKGAAGIIFVNSDTAAYDPDSLLQSKSSSFKIPVVFAKQHMYAQLTSGSVIVKITTDIQKQENTGHNVFGYIDNKAAETVVIGAHYDHLGLGQPGSSFSINDKQIHNGADDNASGTAALIELARIYSSSRSSKKNNYLFIAFSGEELGLYGSNFYVKNPALDLQHMNYMINMDMVGRLDPVKKTLLVNGVGTSPAWKPLVSNISIDSIYIKTGEAGVGPSDHTSFYLHDIPVLHFFTGQHSDYHKPSDDADKINYRGELSVIKYISALIDSLDDRGKLKFTATKNEDENKPRFTVSLGIMPDYMFDGPGIRVDGVTEGKPASKAGILKGDIIMIMGELEVNNMTEYMKALSLFKKGDKVQVHVKRNGNVNLVEVTF
jgi:aminopeptidase YwaD